METPTDTFKTSISLPGHLARFVDEEVEIAGHQHRSKTIQQALRLMGALKRKMESLPGDAESVELEGITFSREEIASLFPQWSAGEHRTLNSEHRTSKGGECALTAGPAPLTLTPTPTLTLPAGDHAGASLRAHTGRHEPAASSARSSATRRTRAQAIENRESRIENSPAQ